MAEKVWDITDKTALESAGAEVLMAAKDLPKDKAVVLALQGDLGAGKTTFVQTLAKQLGITETVTSPTFVIMKKYKTADPRFSSLVHIDAYRLEKVDEIKILGFEAELATPGTIICIEWAERVAVLLPNDTIGLNFTLQGETRTLIQK